MGNLIQALKMIMEGLGDVNHAIEFCKEQNDEELWENLISYSLDKPSESYRVFTLRIKNRMVTNSSLLKVSHFLSLTKQSP